MNARSDFYREPGDVETLEFGWGRVNITASPKVCSAAAFSAGVVALKPGCGHERHNHPGAEEIIYVVAGTGEQMVEDERGDPVIRQVGPGATIYVPADRYHSTFNSGSEEMRLFVVYSPAGAEVVLRETPDCRVIPVV